ncbi:hypothetical protein ANO11243_094150 [Dothideomycetidae sp. 11243]|nr:hypothetical protein ANO11243_094150 [fungal sp. No.11243]
MSAHRRVGKRHWWAEVPAMRGYRQPWAIRGYWSAAIAHTGSSQWRDPAKTSCPTALDATDLDCAHSCEARQSMSGGDRLIEVAKRRFLMQADTNCGTGRSRHCPKRPSFGRTVQAVEGLLIINDRRRSSPHGLPCLAIISYFCPAAIISPIARMEHAEAIFRLFGVQNATDKGTAHLRKIDAEPLADTEQCDERAGSCLNCERHSLVCPGYPDRFDVLLRLRTARARPLRRLSPSQTSQYTSTDASPSSAATVLAPTVPTSPAICHQLELDPDTVTLGMLYTNQCIDKTSLCSVDQVKGEGNGCFFAAVKTLCITQIPKKRYLPHGFSTLHASYAEAINLLNAALASPAHSLLDSTLLATMLMSAIEIKAAPSMSSEYWEQHTRGAAALLQLRGADQVTTSAGSALYFQVASQLMTSCMIAGRHVPLELYSLRTAVRVHVEDERHPVWMFQGALFQCVDFLARADKAGFDDVSTMIRDAFKIYSELVNVFKNADIGWHYTSHPSLRFPGLLDYEIRYQSVLAAQLWHSWRCAVIVLCNCIATVRSASPIQPSLEPEVQQFYDSVFDILERVTLDTIAAVPHAVSSIESKATGKPVPTNDPSICDRGPSYHKPVFRRIQTRAQILPLLHGCSEPWAVWYGVQSNHLRPQIRTCLFNILDAAGARLGVHQWKTLADQLRPIVEGLSATQSQNQTATHVACTS